MEGLQRVVSLIVTGAVMSGSMLEAEEPATLLAERSSLPNIGEKLSNGKSVTIAWIGGSITIGGGQQGYAYRVERWLNKQYPDATIETVNAGIGGTDSAFGAKRFDKHVLKFKPDLICIEFCVNDGGRDHTMHMERMIHKAWLNNPNTDIVIFYTLAKSHLKDYAEGKMPRAASFHEKVARHYNIPTIGTGLYIAKALEKGDLQWEQFSRDSCHPSEDGYALFEEHLTDSFATLLKGGVVGEHKLITPLTGNLQVYPPEINTTTLKPGTYVNGAGEKALESYRLPTPSVHWVQEPAFDLDGGKALWRLHWMKRPNQVTHDTVGVNKVDWSENLMEWFSEGPYYVGPSGTPLFAKSGDRATLTMSGKELSVISFLAPKTGKYEFTISHNGIGSHKSLDKVYSLNMIHFKWGDAQGTSLLYKEDRKENIEAETLTRKCELVAGEEVVFIAGSNAPGSIRGGFKQFDVNVGYYGK